MCADHRTNAPVTTAPLTWPAAKLIAPTPCTASEIATVACAISPNRLAVVMRCCWKVRTR
jgi:hypothetical protein